MAIHGPNAVIGETGDANYPEDTSILTEADDTVITGTGNIWPGGTISTPNFQMLAGSELTISGDSEIIVRNGRNSFSGNSPLSTIQGRLIVEEGITLIITHSEDDPGPRLFGGTAGIGSAFYSIPRLIIRRRNGGGISVAQIQNSEPGSIISQLASDNLIHAAGSAFTRLNLGGVRVPLDPGRDYVTDRIANQPNPPGLVAATFNTHPDYTLDTTYAEAAVTGGTAINNAARRFVGPYQSRYNRGPNQNVYINIATDYAVFPLRALNTGNPTSYESSQVGVDTSPVDTQREGGHYIVQYWNPIFFDNQGDVATGILDPGETSTGDRDTITIWPDNVSYVVGSNTVPGWLEFTKSGIEYDHRINNGVGIWRQYLSLQASVSNIGVNGSITSNDGSLIDARPTRKRWRWFDLFTSITPFSEMDGTIAPIATGLLQEATAIPTLQNAGRWVPSEVTLEGVYDFTTNSLQQKSWPIEDRYLFIADIITKAPDALGPTGNLIDFTSKFTARSINDIWTAVRQLYITTRTDRDFTLNNGEWTLSRRLLIDSAATAHSLTADTITIAVNSDSTLDASRDITQLVMNSTSSQTIHLRLNGGPMSNMFVTGTGELEVGSAGELRSGNNVGIPVSGGGIIGTDNTFQEAVDFSGNIGERNTLQQTSTLRGNIGSGTRLEMNLIIPQSASSITIGDDVTVSGTTSAAGVNITAGASFSSGALSVAVLVTGASPTITSITSSSNVTLGGRAVVSGLIDVDGTLTLGANTTEITGGIIADGNTTVGADSTLGSVAGADTYTFGANLTTGNQFRLRKDATVGGLVFLGTSNIFLDLDVNGTGLSTMGDLCSFVDLDLVGGVTITAPTRTTITGVCNIGGNAILGTSFSVSGNFVASGTMDSDDGLTLSGTSATIIGAANITSLSRVSATISFSSNVDITGDDNRFNTFIAVIGILTDTGNENRYNRLQISAASTIGENVTITGGLTSRGRLDVGIGTVIGGVIDSFGLVSIGELDIINASGMNNGIFSVGASSSLIATSPFEFLNPTGTGFDGGFNLGGDITLNGLALGGGGTLNDNTILRNVDPLTVGPNLTVGTGSTINFETSLTELSFLEDGNASNFGSVIGIATLTSDTPITITVASVGDFIAGTNVTLEGPPAAVAQDTRLQITFASGHRGSGYEMYRLADTTYTTPISSGTISADTIRFTSATTAETINGDEYTPLANLIGGYLIIISSISNAPVQSAFAVTANTVLNSLPDVVQPSGIIRVENVVDQSRFVNGSTDILNEIISNAASATVSPTLNADNEIVFDVVGTTEMNYLSDIAARRLMAVARSTQAFRQVLLRQMRVDGLIPSAGSTENYDINQPNSTLWRMREDKYIFTDTSRARIQVLFSVEDSGASFEPRDTTQLRTRLNSVMNANQEPEVIGFPALGEAATATDLDGLATSENVNQLKENQADMALGITRSSANRPHRVILTNDPDNN